MSTENPNRPAFVVLYRWRLRPGSEGDFVRGWSRISEQLVSRGSLGSRLHCGSDGIWYSYAQWPSARARADAFSVGDIDETAKAQMSSAIAEQFPEIILDPIADYIIPVD
ncbi:hypothetical protein [Paraburkholderia sp. RL17-381-BIF-C]|uniref:hypothetical protein n=1 Tax=Paraburkholderia sp. RL17-381-BIF-C TaxID=3031635 RepID=UPI0038BCA1D4